MAQREGLAGRIVTCTTRPPRPGEVDGVHYRFLSPDAFEASFQAGELLEREQIHGHWYGAPLSAVAEALEAGRIIVVPLGYEGARRFKALWPEHTTVVFVMPPDLEALRERLGRRGDDAAVAEVRLAGAREEMALAAQADAVVVNDDLDAAYARLRAIILGARAAAGR
jgi:guanylate kinase